MKRGPELPSCTDVRASTARQRSAARQPRHSAHGSATQHSKPLGVQAASSGSGGSLLSGLCQIRPHGFIPMDSFPWDHDKAWPLVRLGCFNTATQRCSGLEARPCGPSTHRPTYHLRGSEERALQRGRHTCASTRTTRVAETNLKAMADTCGARDRLNGGRRGIHGNSPDELRSKGRKVRMMSHARDRHHVVVSAGGYA